MGEHRFATLGHQCLKDFNARLLIVSENAAHLGRQARRQFFHEMGGRSLEIIRPGDRTQHLRGELTHRSNGEICPRPYIQLDLFNPCTAKQSGTAVSLGLCDVQVSAETPIQVGTTLQRKPDDQMLRIDGVPGLRETRTDALDHATPVLNAGQVDRNTLELGDARRIRLGINRAVVPDGDHRHRFGAGLVDVTPLRYAGHDDERFAVVNLPLVYVAQAPIIETAGGQLGDAAWRRWCMNRCKRAR